MKCGREDNLRGGAIVAVVDEIKRMKQAKQTTCLYLSAKRMSRDYRVFRG
jgi:hypothetical protein